MQPLEKAAWVLAPRRGQREAGYAEPFYSSAQGLHFTNADLLYFHDLQESLLSREFYFIFVTIRFQSDYKLECPHVCAFVPL